MTNLQALLFDVDGTLVDTEELHRQAFNEAFLEYGLDWEWDASRYAELLAVSGGLDRIMHFIDTLDMSAPEKMRLRRVASAIHRGKTRIYGRLIGSNTVRLRPGVARLVEEARQAKITIGLAATSAPDNVEALVSAAFSREARKAIGPIVCAALVPRPKPAPDLYEFLLTTMRLPAEACIAFEDSQNGVASAKGAGLLVVATPSRWTIEQSFAQADLVLPSLGDPSAPLEGTAAARIGGASCLGLDQLIVLRSALSQARPVSVRA